MKVIDTPIACLRFIILFEHTSYIAEQATDRLELYVQVPPACRHEFKIRFVYKYFHTLDELSLIPFRNLIFQKSIKPSTDVVFPEQTFQTLATEVVFQCFLVSLYFHDFVQIQSDAMYILFHDFSVNIIEIHF